MAKAKILKNKRVIQVDNLDKDFFFTDLDGFLIEFTVGKNFNSNTYIYRETHQFKDVDIPTLPLNRNNYYKKDVFLSYLSGSVNLETLKNETLDRDNRIKNAVKNDEIDFDRLLIKFPYDTFYDIAEWSFLYSGEFKSLFDNNGNIIIPDNTQPKTRKPIYTSTEADFFYHQKIQQINLFKDEERDRAAYLITKCALLIGMINDNIFPLFRIGTDNYETYINDQNLEWQNGNFINYTLESLNIFFEGLNEYYNKAFNNQGVIATSSGVSKLYWFAMLLSINALSVLPLESKLDLLNLACKKLSSTKEKLPEENLVINILLAFNANNISQIDDLLAHLLKFPVVDSNQSLYEILYSKMSSSTNIKEGFLGLSNWVFNTSFKPTKTKEQFVQAVYALWQFSKYNPYKEDGSIKNNSIGFKILNTSTADYDNKNEAPNTMYSYSYEVSYKVIKTPNIDPLDPLGSDNISYNVVYQDAAPILLPYESEKFGGIFFDNFNFKFDGAKIIATQQFLLSTKPVQGGIGTIGLLKNEFQDVTYGTYDIYQPVSLLSTNLQTKTAISTVNGNDINVRGQNINSLIPVFVLKFIDDAGDRSDVETVIGYVVDVVSTYTGIGALTKLKHLRWATFGENVGLFTRQGLKLVVGGVDFSTGVLGFFANFVECDSNDGFCNGVKSFIMALQLASLTINSADSLVSFTMKRSAAKVIEEAGGLNETEIIQNIKNRLAALKPGASLDDAEEAAKAIYKSGYLYSFPANILLAIEKKIKEVIKSRNNFSLHAAYTDAIIEDFIRKCDKLGLDQKTIEDLVINANRNDVKNTLGQITKRKYIDPNELNLRIDNYIKIRNRGYAAGFVGLTQYSLFSQMFKSKIIQNLEIIGGEFDDILQRAEWYFKGSAVQSWKGADEIIAGIREADDADLAIKLSRTDFNLFKEELIRCISEYDGMTDGQINSLVRKIGENGAKLQYDEIFKPIPINNSNFSEIIASACEPFCKFKTVNNKSKIGFAILIKNGKYDNLPEIPLKF